MTAGTKRETNRRARWIVAAFVAVTSVTAVPSSAHAAEPVASSPSATTKVQVSTSLRPVINMMGIRW